MQNCYYNYLQSYLNQTIPQYYYPYFNSHIYNDFTQQNISFNSYYPPKQIPRNQTNDNLSITDEKKTETLKTQEQLPNNQNLIKENYSINQKKQGDKLSYDNQTVISQKNITANCKSKDNKKYLKKNTQSNICHQILAFLINRAKSQKKLKRIFQYDGSYTPQKVNAFYSYIKIVKRYTKIYFNKKQLLILCKYNQKHDSFKQLAKNPKKFKILSIVQFSKVLRILIFNFLDYDSCICILNSKKIQKQTQIKHFQRIKQIKHYLRDQLAKE